PVIFLACDAVHYGQPLVASRCPVSQTFAVGTENGSASQNPVIFLAFHSIHHDQPLVATPCPESHSFTVRTPPRSLRGDQPPDCGVDGAAALAGLPLGHGSSLFVARS